MNIREFFWPTLEALSSSALANAGAKQHAERESIDCARLKGNPDFLIAEARRLFDAELDRRRTAEARGTSYIAAVVVLMPILTTITPAQFDLKKSIALPIITLVMFASAAAYTVAVIYWAFKALAAAEINTLGANDLRQIGEDRNSQSKLLKGLLTCILLNYSETNKKVDAAKMSREFALRAGITFALAMLVRSTWTPAGIILGLIFK